jgi:uncharacterized membrane-anchored protein
MKPQHLPQVDLRYWAAITMASVFGTNMGDLYAHESGLGIVRGLLLLAVFAAVAFLFERRDQRAHVAWYWLAIVVIRTGATNIADYMAFRMKIEPVLLAVSLCALLAALGWFTHRAATRNTAEGQRLMPKTDGMYWAAMLTAGVLGTVLGDDAAHLIGLGWASLGLGAALALVLATTRGIFPTIMGYWAAIGLARTAGTAIGDFLAERDGLHLGLPVSTLITGTLFILVAAWPAWAARKAASAA